MAATGDAGKKIKFVFYYTTKRESISTTAGRLLSQSDSFQCTCKSSKSYPSSRKQGCAASLLSYVGTLQESASSRC